MLKISKLADYATVIMVYFAKHHKESHNAKQIAESTHISQPTVSKLLKLLTKSELLISQRGALGGYALTRAPSTINVAQIIAVVDGQIALTDCHNKEHPCELLKRCSTKQGWTLINSAIYKALINISLADMIEAHFQSEIKIALNSK